MPDDLSENASPPPPAPPPPAEDTPPPDPWEIAARTMIRSRAEKLPPAFRDLLAAFPGSAGPDALVKFLEQAEAAVEGARERNSQPPSPLPANREGGTRPSPDPRERGWGEGSEPKPTDARRKSAGEPDSGDSRLWAELMNDGRKALDLKRRRPDLYESLRRRHAGRRPTRKD